MATTKAYGTPATETAGTDESGMQPSVSSGAIIGITTDAVAVGQHIGSPGNGTAAPGTYPLTPIPPTP